MRIYGISQVGYGYSASMGASFFISSAHGKDVANSESEGFEGSIGILYGGGSNTTGKNLDKFNIGFSVSELPVSGTYWGYIETSEIFNLKEVFSWIKEKIF